MGKNKTNSLTNKEIKILNEELESVYTWAYNDLLNFINSKNKEYKQANTDIASFIAIMSKIALRVDKEYLIELINDAYIILEQK